MKTNMKSSSLNWIPCEISFMYLDLVSSLQQSKNRCFINFKDSWIHCQHNTDNWSINTCGWTLTRTFRKTKLESIVQLENRGRGLNWGDREEGGVVGRWRKAIETLNMAWCINQWTPWFVCLLPINHLSVSMNHLAVIYTICQVRLIFAGKYQPNLHIVVFQ